MVWFGVRAEVYPVYALNLIVVKNCLDLGNPLYTICELLVLAGVCDGLLTLLALLRELEIRPADLFIGEDL